MRRKNEHLKKLVLMLILAFIIKEAIAAVMTIALTVGNPVPRVQNVRISDNPLILIENSQKTVWCNATINDTNGWQDIVSARGVIWDNSNATYDSSDDYNNHYTNSSCALYSGSGTARDTSCLFRVYYFANPGNWSCRITAEDTLTQESYNETGFNITTFLGLTTSSEINFGTMTPGSTSNSSVTTYINNTCNQQIDILLNSQSDVNCTIGSIPAINVHYNSTDMDHSSMCNLTTSTTDTCNEVSNNFNLAKCTTISGTPLNPSKNVYWRIKVPIGVSGTCTTTLMVTAKEG